MENREFLEEKYLVRYCGCLLKNLNNKKEFEGIVQCLKCCKEESNIYAIGAVEKERRELFYRIPKPEEVLKILFTRETKELEGALAKILKRSYYD